MSDYVNPRSLGSEVDVDAVVVGAGVTGIYQLHRLREAGLRVLALEAADSIGGTWRWNRYPGCRLDSESYSYGYFFSQELWEEWNWSEHFVTQPELERYMNFVVEKFDLAPHIRLNSKVTAASFDDEHNVWTVNVNGSEIIRSRHIILATGQLSTPFEPQVKGKESFQGQMYHTFEWPADGVDLTGKRVAVMGAGSTGVQLAPVIAEQVEELIMFQRTANWCTPLNNGPITEDEQREIKDHRERYEQLTLKSPGGFLHAPTRGEMFEDSVEERTALFERLYAEGRGFQKIYGHYRDTSLNPEANRALGEFFARKIRERVNDPVVAEKLIPKDHGPNMKRPPMETNYYEMYNRSNVKLVDLRETPIEEITPHGVRTTEEEFELDVIVWATGFDAITGAIKQLDLRGRDGLLLTDKWKAGMLTLWGVMVPQFPNMFI
ncbi:flavin-containing monooxygenase, partial [Paenarthrobacter aurescens]|uniref:flavin-containing monooxygenase n=1 Tax=Paenarthrobacter aurescens TaxID=43663 RepID=UPI0035E7DDD8